MWEEGAADARALRGRGVGGSVGRRPARHPLPRRRDAGGRGRRGHRRRHRAGDRRGVPRLPRGPVAGHVGARARRPVAPHGRPARAGHRGRGPRRVAGHRQAPGREPVRRRRRGGGVPLLRPGRGGGRRTRGRHRQRRRGQPDRARAGGCLRADRAVELPAAPSVLEGRALPGRRQHVRAEAERAHPAHLDPPDAPAGGGRAPGRRRQPGAGRRPRRWCGPGHRPPRRPRLVHRRRADRPRDHGRGGRDREAGRPRARAARTPTSSSRTPTSTSPSTTR